MRFDRDALVFKALCALDEIADTAREGPIPRTFATRFVLAFLFMHSDGKREPYDAFWRHSRDIKEGSLTQTMAATMRSTYTRTAFTAIARSVGIELDIETMAALAEARKHRQPQ